MDPNKTTLERAFELARSGQCESLRMLRKQLKRERYDQRQLMGRGLIKQLSGIIEKALDTKPAE